MQTLLLLAFGAVVALPAALALPPDDEGFAIEIATTRFQHAALALGQYPFWDPLSGFGAPQPLSESLIFHPFLLFAGIFSLATAVGLVYVLQMCVAVLAVWGCCRQIGLHRATAALCTVTFALSSSAVEYLNSDFWPSVLVGWSLSPVLLLLLLKLFDARSHSLRLAYSLGAGACAALMLLDGHAGAFPYLALAFAAFLAGEWRRVRDLWPWLLLALATFVLGIATKLVDVGLEAAREPSSDPRLQIHYGFDLWRAFFYPIHSPFGAPAAPSDRLLAIGGPFAVLILLGLFRATGRYLKALRLVVVVTLLAWFVPVRVLSVLSGNFLTRDPLILFGVLLAGITLEQLWRDRPSRRNLLLGASLLQVVILVVGFWPTYHSSLQRWSAFRGGDASASLKGSFENLPLYRYFEQRPGIRQTRVYAAHDAEHNFWRQRGSYEYAGWSLHGLRFVNGEFRGVDQHEFAPDPYTLHGTIRANPSFALNDAALDALDIGYVLATPGEAVSPSLRRIARFTISGNTVVAYRNPAAWADAEVVAPSAETVRLPELSSCTTPGLMCADFRPLAALRRPGVLRATWHGADLTVALTPSPQSRLVVVSQAYRPGWKASFSGGAVSGHEIVGGLTAFDLPPGVSHVTVEFRPTGRIVAAIVSWVALLGAIAVALGALFRGRRERPA